MCSEVLYINGVSLLLIPETSMMSIDLNLMKIMTLNACFVKEFGQINSIFLKNGCFFYR